jgi:PPOX class probable F420-dependent enzyme
MALTPDQLSFIEARRVAHLGTASAAGVPHVVPVCFAYYEGCFWAAIDEKPKTGARLKRLRNIEENARVSLVFDCWDEDWRRLAYVLVHGRAGVIERGERKPGALAELRRRYPQYREMRLEERPLVRIAVERVTSWGDLTGG